jgi:flavodoxin
MMYSSTVRNHKNIINLTFKNQSYYSFQHFTVKPDKENLMKPKMATSSGRILLVLLLALVLFGCVGPAQQLTPADMSITRPDASSLVVVHSRTGNTALMGQLISGKMNSDYIRLDVPEGSQDSVLSVPNRNENMEITPRKIDLSKYELVFLGSPIWFMHPTAFIYSFIKNNDFTAKEVVLFYTYGGGLAKTAIEEWKGLVEQRGGTVIDVIGIDRSDLKTDEALKEEVNVTIDKQKSIWMGGENQ